MTLEYALKHIAKKLQRNMSDLDAEALKFIASYIESQDNRVLNTARPFAKLVVYMFRVEAEKGKPATVILREIEEILQMPIIQHLELMAMETPIYRFEQIIHKGCENLDPIRDFEKIKTIRISNLMKNEQAAREALSGDYTVEQAQQFITHQVHRLLKSYNDYD